jgi:T3SS (YopN, CesT) and YbjN peptide-binding chaperone 1
MPDSEQLKILRETCKNYMTKSGLKFMIDMDQDFVLLFDEGVRVFVMPREWAGNKTVVSVMAPCNKGMRIDGELGLFLSEENGKLLFGKLALYREKEEIHFEHTLLGDFLNQAELEVAIGLVAASTNNYDDLIKKKWGGRKAAEL